MKAIIPIAGLGTRLLPFSKVIPKAMLPVHDRPSIQWIVEELVDAGVEDIIIVYSKGQEMVKDYFDEQTWYDEELRNRDKHDHADQLESIRKLANFHFVEQEAQLGDGHAILQAEAIVNEEPSIVIFGDCLYHGDDMIKKCIQHYRDHGRSIIAVQDVDPQETHHYGIVEPKTDADYIIESMVEKPRPEEAPSTKAIIGRYLLSPGIWKHLKNLHSGSGEARLIDALQALQNEEEIHHLIFTGTWLDTGSLEGLHRANLHYKSHF